MMGRSLSVFWLAVWIGCGVAAIADCGRLESAGQVGFGGVLEVSWVGFQWLRQYGVFGGQCCCLVGSCSTARSWLWLEQVQRT
jgi:hypothetical protein